MVGIDISDRSIKLVRLTDKEPRQFVSHCMYEMPGGIMENGIILEQEQLRQALKTVLKKCKISKSDKETFVFSIPETRSFLRVIEVPQMQEDEVTEAIKWEVAQHIPFGLEHVYIDWQPIKTIQKHTATKDRQEIQVGAAQKKIVDVLYDTLKVFNIDIAAFELESQAIIRSLISDDLQDQAGIVVVDIGGTATNVIIHDHGAMRFTASLQKGLLNALQVLSASEQEALTGPKALTEEQKETMTPKLESVTNDLVSEILSIAEFYSSIDSEHQVKEIILTGGGSNLPTLDAAFLSHFDDILIQRGNPWSRLIRDKKSRKPLVSLAESVRYSTAFGLALRPVVFSKL